MTIGNVAADKLATARTKMHETNHLETLDNLIQEAYKAAGDSVERVLLIKTIMDKIDTVRGFKRS